jgi:hypothetical protein
MTSSSPFCLRCRTVELEHVDQEVNDDVKFFRCPTCFANYTSNNGVLVDRWLMPITLPLYRVIFSPNPEHADPSIPVAECEQRDPQRIALMIKDIERELAEPTQPLNAVLPGPYETAPGRDEALRRYLRRFVDALRATQKK